ncbi:unnamed protein product [Triticum turgidum subsp. durum]|uniref:RNase H type-1 domain-containing protein n=1 Tax=Triticum turgidum subsp. durum TaxID=4567 RepID=A0A9R0XNU9_TRITD|nr:unnamed protein product [Triticum turgidum subsp. durum]
MYVSVSFLKRYLEELAGIKMNQGMDPAKGKGYLTFDQTSAAIKPQSAGPVCKWRPPNEGWVKLNTDGSYVDSDNAGAGMILRNSTGGIIFSACRSLFSCRDAVEAELGAIMEGLSLAIQWSELPVAIETDSSLAVAMVTSTEVDRSIYAALVNEIRLLMRLRQTCVTHVLRVQNKASYSLARFARVEGRIMTWLGSGPDEVLGIFLDDCKDIIT